MLSDDLTRIDGEWLKRIGFSQLYGKTEYVMRVENNLRDVYYINLGLARGATFGYLLCFIGESDDGVDPIVSVESKTYVTRGDVRLLLDALGVTTEPGRG